MLGVLNIINNVLIYMNLILIYGLAQALQESTYT